MRDSMSSVAARPTEPTPQSSPTSLPTFSGLLTPTPTSSKAGCPRISGITSFPTKPVPQTTTRLVICGSSSLLVSGSLGSSGGTLEIGAVASRADVGVGDAAHVGRTADAHERDHAARRAQPGADPHRAVEAGGERAEADVRAREARDGGDEGDRDEARHAGGGVVDRRADTDVVLVDRGEDGGGERRHGQGEPEAEHHDAREHGADVGGAGTDAGEEGEPDPRDER